jgi:hypothetical protein
VAGDALLTPTRELTLEMAIGSQRLVGQFALVNKAPEALLLGMNVLAPLEAAIRGARVYRVVATEDIDLEGVAGKCRALVVGRVCIQGDLENRNQLFAGDGVVGELAPSDESGRVHCPGALSQPVSWKQRTVTLELTNFGEAPVRIPRGRGIACWTPLHSVPTTVLVTSTDHLESGAAPTTPAPPGRSSTSARKEEGVADQQPRPAGHPAARSAEDENVVRKQLQARIDAVPGLSAAQREQAKAVLVGYSSCFADKLDYAGEARLPGGARVEHRIDTGDAPPARCGPRRESPQAREAQGAQVRELSRIGAVEPSSSPYAAPVVMVRKKDGTWRFCIDYRLLNRDTRRDAYPLPRIDDIQQIPVAAEDRHKTAFVVWGQLLQWKVLPFGLTNAPPTFQRFMDVLLSGLNWKCCVVYLDDIVIFSRSFEQHLKDLSAVLDRVREAGVVLKTAKCEFFSSEMRVLGHIVGRDGVRPDPEKTRAVEALAAPSLRAGLCGGRRASRAADAQGRRVALGCRAAARVRRAQGGTRARAHPAPARLAPPFPPVHRREPGRDRRRAGAGGRERRRVRGVLRQQDPRGLRVHGSDRPPGAPVVASDGGARRTLGPLDP